MSINAMRQVRYLAGPASAILFGLSLFGFAAMRVDGYSHATKAVSELGSIDAPAAFAFNMFGFIIPGSLVIIFAAALMQKTSRRTGPLLLVGSGIFLILAGLAPTNLDNPEALSSMLHLVGAMGSGTLWVLALFWLGPMLRNDFDLPQWGRITPWFSLFLFLNVGWQIAFVTTGLVLPGWGQRIGFLGYFLWVATTGILLCLKKQNDE